MPACDLTGIVLIQIICGVGFGIGNVIPLANAGKGLNDSQQILSMGIFQTIYSIGITTGPAFTGFLFDYTGNDYSLTFMILAAVAAGSAALTFIAYKNPAAKETI
jgi:predicted MFS family arabinose efflux permease